MPFSKRASARAGSIAESAPQGFQVALRELSRRERWLWISLAATTSLAAIAYLLSTFPGARDARYELLRIAPETAAPALLALLLLFNVYLLYRRALVQRERKTLLPDTPDAQDRDAAEVSEIDPVTGLLNRAAAVERVAKELAAARRAGKPLSVLIADIDDFGRINSQFGQASGDTVLREFARQLKRATRGVDLVVRMGNDEFLAILPECAVASVPRVTDRITPMTVNCQGRELEVTCSVSSFDHHHGDSAEELLNRADQMLRLYSQTASALTH